MGASLRQLSTVFKSKMDLSHSQYPDLSSPSLLIPHLLSSNSLLSPHFLSTCSPQPHLSSSLSPSLSSFSWCSGKILELIISGGVDHQVKRTTLRPTHCRINWGLITTCGPLLQVFPPSIHSCLTHSSIKRIKPSKINLKKNYAILMQYKDTEPYALIGETSANQS